MLIRGGCLYVYSVEARVEPQLSFRSDPLYFLRQELPWLGTHVFSEAMVSDTESPPDFARLTLGLQHCHSTQFLYEGSGDQT